MMIRKVNWVAWLCGLGLLANGCGDKKEDESKEEEEETTTGGVASTGGGATPTVTATSLTELKLSSALNINIPAALGGSGAALHLTSGKKSREACEVGSTVGDAMDRLLQVGEMFCHFELEPAIKFGEKFDISISGGGGGALQDQGAPESFQIWIDNSEAASGKLKVYMCEGGKLNNVMTLTGAKAGGGVEGTAIAAGDWEGNTYADSVVFDAGFSKAGRIYLSNKGTYKGTDGGEFKRQVVLDLNDGGVSVAAVANKGIWMGNSFEHNGAARIDASFGQVLFKSSGTWEGQVSDWVHRASFNSLGEVVLPSASADLADAGKLFVRDADVPKPLAADFKPEGFPADAWDCTGGTKLTLSMDGEKGQSHMACERKRVEHNCYDQEAFSEGEADDLDVSQQKESTEFDNPDAVTHEGVTEEPAPTPAPAP